MTLRLLVADSEHKAARDERRRHVGQSAGESFVEFLAGLEPKAEITLATPADDDALAISPATLAGFAAVFLTGSPLHIYDDSPEVRREIAFMRAVFASGTPSFGSCAGLQVAVAAAGGTVRPARHREAGIARRITPTPAGRAHPLLAGRPFAYDALTLHGDEVARLPPRATLLASSARCPVQAVEIRHDQGVFWGVQYHPELTLHEIAAALRRDGESLIEAGLARGMADVQPHADLIEALGDEPDRADLRWRLGVDEEITAAAARHREIRNFLNHVSRPASASGTRGMADRAARPSDELR